MENREDERAYQLQPQALLIEKHEGNVGSELEDRQGKGLVKGEGQVNCVNKQGIH